MPVEGTRWIRSRHPTMHRMTGVGNEHLLDRSGARALDHAAITEYGIPGIELMEQAARGCTDHVRSMTDPGDAILILVGRGNNGGDGWAMARQLHEAGHPVEVRSLGSCRSGSDAEVNEARARNLRISVGMDLDRTTIEHAALVVDALFGTGLDRPIEGMAAEWLALLEQVRHPSILSVDLPSGLDANSGMPTGPVVKAARTVTFVAPKLGMARPDAAIWCGRIDVVGIGTPDSLLPRFGIRTSN